MAYEMVVKVWWLLMEFVSDLFIIRTDLKLIKAKTQRGTAWTQEAVILELVKWHLILLIFEMPVRYIFISSINC